MKPRVLKMLIKCNLDINPGWKHILAHWLEEVKDEPISVLQVKEKFGSLRIYYDLGHDGNYELTNLATRDAMHRASKTCQLCGLEGALREDLPWLATLCEEHYKAKLESSPQSE